MAVSGEVSPTELVESSLKRIASVDPQVGAFCEVWEEFARSRALQLESIPGEDRVGCLWGVPVAVKDNVAVSGARYGQGTAMRVMARRDAAVVAALRREGAVLVGQTRAPELCLWHFTESLSQGATRNPWNLGRTPGGSSGGSAAAVATGMVYGAQGSDGASSIRNPAACCGVVGVKPQRNRVPMAPHGRHWHGLTVFGPIARTVEDAAALLDAMADPAAPGPNLPASKRFLDAANAEPPRLRVAVSIRAPVSFARLDPEIRELMLKVARLLEDAGHMVEVADPDYRGITNNFLLRYLRGVGDDLAAVPDASMLEHRTVSLARLGRCIPSGAARHADTASLQLLQQMGQFFECHDVLITPTLAQLPPPVGHWQQAGAIRTLWGAANFSPFTVAWNVTGQPALSLPAGVAKCGLPIGVQIVGRSHDEATMLSVAAELERLVDFELPRFDECAAGAEGAEQ